VEEEELKLSLTLKSVAALPREM